MNPTVIDSRAVTTKYTSHDASLDENARVIPDPDHSESEDRFVLLGLSIRLRVVVVCHCYRTNEDVVRIISARKITAAERNEYMR